MNDKKAVTLLLDKREWNYFKLGCDHLHTSASSMIREFIEEKLEAWRELGMADVGADDE